MTSGPDSVDVVVVGGGLSGLATAHALATRELSVIHVAPAAAPDHRTSALMMPSVQILETLGLVSEPGAIGTPLTAIRIIDATDRLVRAPEALFEASEAGLDAFAWNFANTALAEAFRSAGHGHANLASRDDKVAALSRDGDTHTVELEGGEILKTRLVVGADGKNSRIRDAAEIPVTRTPFRQSALVCDLQLERPLAGTSVEFHYPNGPFTLVPAGADKANLVWIDDARILEEARAEGTDALTRLFHEKTQHLFGHVNLTTGTFVFPLGNLSARPVGKDGIVLVGEAAHAFPPIGAQGLNLGLRDVADLLASIDDAPRDALDWARRISADYARRREGDLARTGLFVDTLYRSLVSSLLPAHALRAGGLWALRGLPSLRKQAFALGMGQR